MIDYVTVLLGRGGSIQEKWFLQALISKTVFIILMLFIRRFSKTRKSCGLITGKEWLQFFCVPVFTVVGFILMFYSENDDMQNVFLFLSVGLVAINLILMEFMQNTIEKEERIKIAVLTEQNQKIVLQIIRTGKKSMSVSEEKCTIIKISFPQSRR